MTTRMALAIMLLASAVLLPGAMGISTTIGAHGDGCAVTINSNHAIGAQDSYSGKINLDVSQGVDAGGSDSGTGPMEKHYIQSNALGTVATYGYLLNSDTWNYKYDITATGSKLSSSEEINYKNAEDAFFGTFGLIAKSGIYAAGQLLGDDGSKLSGTYKNAMAVTSSKIAGSQELIDAAGGLQLASWVEKGNIDGEVKTIEGLHDGEGNPVFGPQGGKTYSNLIKLTTAADSASAFKSYKAAVEGGSKFSGYQNAEAILASALPAVDRAAVDTGPEPGNMAFAGSAVVSTGSGPAIVVNGGQWTFDIGYTGSGKVNQQLGPVLGTYSLDFPTFTNVLTESSSEFSGPKGMQSTLSTLTIGPGSGVLMKHQTKYTSSGTESATEFKGASAEGYSGFFSAFVAPSEGTYLQNTQMMSCGNPTNFGGWAFTKTSFTDATQSTVLTAGSAKGMFSETQKSVVVKGDSQYSDISYVSGSDLSGLQYQTGGTTSFKGIVKTSTIKGSAGALILMNSGSSSGSGGYMNQLQIQNMGPGVPEVKVSYQDYTKVGPGQIIQNVDGTFTGSMMTYTSQHGIGPLGGSLIISVTPPGSPIAPGTFQLSQKSIGGIGTFTGSAVVTCDMPAGYTGSTVIGGYNKDKSGSIEAKMAGKKKVKFSSKVKENSIELKDP